MELIPMNCLLYKFWIHPNGVALDTAGWQDVYYIHTNNCVRREKRRNGTTYMFYWVVCASQSSYHIHYIPNARISHTPPHLSGWKEYLFLLLLCDLNTHSFLVRNGYMRQGWFSAFFVFAELLRRKSKWKMKIYCN